MEKQENKRVPLMNLDFPRVSGRKRKREKNSWNWYPHHRVIWVRNIGCKNKLGNSKFYLQLGVRRITHLQPLTRCWHLKWVSAMLIWEKTIPSFIMGILFLHSQSFIKKSRYLWIDLARCREKCLELVNHFCLTSQCYNVSTHLVTKIIRSWNAT